MITHDVTAWEIIYAVLRARFFWPLYAMLYLCVGMAVKMRWVNYQTRKSLGDSSAYRQAASRIVRESPVQKSEFVAAP